MNKLKKLICVIPFYGFNILIIDKTQEGYIYEKYFGKDGIPHFDMDDCLNTHIYVDDYRSLLLNNTSISDIDRIVDICANISAYGCIENIDDEDDDSCGQNISGIFKIHDYDSLKLFCDLNFHKIDVLNKTICF